MPISPPSKDQEYPNFSTKPLNRIEERKINCVKGSVEFTNIKGSVSEFGKDLKSIANENTGRKEDDVD